MAAPSLTSLSLYVLMADGTEHDAQTRNPDMIRWDRTRAARKWPTFQDAPFLGMTFLAWAALTREGAISCTFDEFETRCQHVEQREALTVDPTMPEAGAG